ncbi:MAG: class I SAM-dependent methyltransferase [Synergistaceae bacterium]|jgi:2-polyprenyl-3-methyl-5-hydroxy-6-metoxy-1,4-benzoquinol methylase|nr:class I SAM-dependent methyltransferase [Synergistaceae bacterium]
MKNSDFDYSYQYSNWHTDTDESRKADVFSAKQLFDIHAIYPHEQESRVLEIGCGIGRTLLMLRGQGYENLTGIDIDESQAETAKKEGLRVYRTDANDFLSDGSEKYHAVYCFDVLEHIEKEEQLPLLKLVNSRLADDGFVVIRVPNALSPTFGYFRYADFTHRVSYTMHTLSFLLHNAGLHYVTVRPERRESLRMQWMKIPWANLYRFEHGLEDFALTPNIVAVTFKDEDMFRNYMSRAPLIQNGYRGPMWLARVIVRRLRKPLVPFRGKNGM